VNTQARCEAIRQLVELGLREAEMTSPSNMPMRNPLPALALVLGLVSPAVAGDDQLTAQDVAQLKHLLQPKFLVAEVIEAASFAAEKCPGLHLIEDNVEAEYHSAGAADDDTHTPEFELMSAGGRANAAEGYAKNPAGWCESMWSYLGPAHPPMIKHILLQRD
jgi:hypothetical protein